MKKIVFFIFIYSIIATSAVFSQTAFERSQAAAREAEQRMNEMLTGTPTGAGSSQSANPVQAQRGGRAPDWASGREPSSFPQSEYITATGEGANRQQAEQRALAALVTLFGVNIEATNVLTEVYDETNTNWNTSFTINTRSQEMISTAASLNTLVGAEIGAVWEDRRATHALAYMNRQRAVVLYTELIKINQAKVDSLINLTTAQKNTFQGYSRYRQAEKIAAINDENERVILVASGSRPTIQWTKPDELRLEAQNIIRNIAVGFTSTGDLNNRVRDAFAKAIAAEGLRTQGTNTPYVMEISVSVEETRFPNNPNIFARYTINANLKERATGAVLIPYNESGRSGHTTFPEARNRAFMDMERLIQDDFPRVFREYLESLAQ